MRLRDLPLFVDHVGDPLRVFVLLAGRRAVRETDLAFGVAEQRKGEVELLGEAAVGVDVIEADAEDVGVAFGVLADEVPEPGPFQRSAGCIGLWIKPEHDFSSAQIRKLHAVAVMVEYIEVGCWIAGFEHANTSQGVADHAAN